MKNGHAGCAAVLCKEEPDRKGWDLMKPAKDGTTPQELMEQHTHWPEDQLKQWKHPPKPEKPPPPSPRKPGLRPRVVDPKIEGGTPDDIFWEVRGKSKKRRDNCRCWWGGEHGAGAHQT